MRYHAAIDKAKNVCALSLFYACVLILCALGALLFVEAITGIVIFEDYISFLFG